MQEGLKQAVMVPLNAARQSFRALKLSETVIKHGIPASLTDAGVGAQMAYSGVIGNIYNVLVNLKDIKDNSFVEDIKKRCIAVKADAAAAYQNAINLIESKLN